MHTVNLKQVEIALEYVSGSDFERFFHAFYSAVTGLEFIPLGGVHDGGADAFQDESLLERSSARPGTYYQASIQEDFRAKIRNTVGRLREFGRTPKVVQYFTSRTVSVIDREEEELSAELEVAIKIRDRKWFVANINRSQQTVSAFQTYLEPYLGFLNQPGGATVIADSPNVPARTMCVFLGQEVDRRRGNTDLLEAVTDSLILWALEGTDPDNGIYMTRQEILTKIETALPSAKQFIRGVFDHRIVTLSSKENRTDREVRHYRKDDKFCLPYETRKTVESENTEDEFLKLQVLDLYQQRAVELLDDGDPLFSRKIADLAHRALELTFEKEGLELAAFLSGTSDENYYGTISDQVDEVIEEANLTGDDAITAKEVSLGVLRQAFYQSEEPERIYYGKLSRTYTLLFTLRNEPKIVEYFKGMSSSFVLFVGSDIIIRSLSERYLPDEDQMTTNMLRILRDAGSKLILTDVIVEEVHAHLGATDYEFQNYFLDHEPYVNMEIARQSEKILIRAYFYAKLDPLVDTRPAGWRSFIEQICSYEELHKEAIAREQVKNYLIAKYEFDYLDHHDLEQLTDAEEVATLADQIKAIKKEEVLALNDARQILAVYGKRGELREKHSPSRYGYRTWWLTHESKVRHTTEELVKQRGAHYIIRPEFILNFVALSPSTQEVQHSYRTVFPTLLGVRLSNRMREDIFHDVMKRAKEVGEVDSARAEAMLVDLSNRIKGENYKQYETDLLAGRLGAD